MPPGPGPLDPAPCNEGIVGISIKLLTSFDGGDIHQESWSREVYLPQLGHPAMCVCVCVCVCVRACVRACVCVCVWLCDNVT